ncbi:MAG: hypothetical protein Q7U89_07375 [Coriobacteriia bacterium]|nr:hypothetical protein [Coriobacteriia bacterium]
MRIAIIQRGASAAVVEPPAGIDLVFQSGAPVPLGIEQLGSVTVLEGDDVLDLDLLRSLALEGTDVLVLMPRSESELQAEAVLEFAIALSDSVAGLVLVVEDDGALPGEPGHGGSMIVLLGEVLGEAMSGSDVIEATVGIPVPQPVPRDPLPSLPTILAQRLANHQGRHLDTEYPSDG